MKINSKNHLKEILYALLVGADPHGDTHHAGLLGEDQNRGDSIAFEFGTESYARWLTAVKDYFGLSNALCNLRILDTFDSISTTADHLWEHREAWVLPWSDERK